jgi:hypothetical protein
MTSSLCFLYSLNHLTISEIEINQADIKESGHGVYKVKKIASN